MRSAAPEHARISRRQVGLSVRIERASAVPLETTTVEGALKSFRSNYETSSDGLGLSGSIDVSLIITPRLWTTRCLR